MFEPLFKELTFYLSYAIEGAAALIIGVAAAIAVAGSVRVLFRRARSTPDARDSHGTDQERVRLAAEAVGPVGVPRIFGLRFSGPTSQYANLSAVVNTIADLEFAMRGREGIKRAFAGWIFVHIVAAIVMYAALTLHIWNSVYFGLRWLQ